MLELVLALAALILGIAGVIQGIRNWAAWGVIALAALHLIPRLL
jgi:hypothetical protein